MAQREYTVVGITEEEFFRTGGADTADAVQKAVAREFRSSMASVRNLVAEGAQASKTDMVVLIRDSFAEGRLPRFEGYIIVLFLNRAALRACKKSGLWLNVLAELDEAELPQPAGVWVKLPLYF